MTLYAQTDAERCSAVGRLSIPDVEVASATLTPAGPVGRGGAVPEHCLVRGAIDKRVGFAGKTFAIGFEMRLPRQMGTAHSFSGRRRNGWHCAARAGERFGREQESALSRGFAVVSTDAGHTGAPPMPEADASFARDQQARIDNAYRSIERVTQVSKLIVMQYY